MYCENFPAGIRQALFSRGLEYTQSGDSLHSEGELLIAQENFLQAAESGDVHTVSRILKDNPGLDIECSDALGRTALRLAIKNEHLAVVNILLEKFSQHHIYEAVLQAISDGHTQIAETILKHRRYLEMWSDRKRVGATDGFYKTAFSDSQFSPDITPLILASQKNQYEIVQLLLLRGETIMKPHKFSCACQECHDKMKFDQLRLAKYRLNAYKGLASEAYISLSSRDPIMTAFLLGDELKSLSKEENKFKREYKELEDQLSNYVVKLLDRIRTQKELELVLNKTGKPHQEKFASLARFKLALKLKQKKRDSLRYSIKQFVAHPSCQQGVIRVWHHGIEKFIRAGWPYRLLMILVFILAYPALVFVHLVFPHRKEAKILNYPAVKLFCHSVAFLGLLILIFVSSTESSFILSNKRNLSALYNLTIFKRYSECREKSNDTLYGSDFPLRSNYSGFTNILLVWFIIGNLYHICLRLYQSALKEHIGFYNALDFLLLCAYIAALALRYLLLIKFKVAVNMLSGSYVNPCSNIQYIYWLNTDRKYWHSNDPRNVSECLFAFANLLTFIRMSYLLPAFEMLGALQISMLHMLKDIAKLAVVFVIVFFAFTVGLHNLYWYYSVENTIELNTTIPVKAQKHFGSVEALLKTTFWSLFGRGDRYMVELGNYDAATVHFGYFITGVYNIATVTVLVNMLIAMMSRSFTRIAKDTDREWKFARSQLYMDYIGHRLSLPPPLNVLFIPKNIYKIIKSSGKDTVPPEPVIEPENFSILTMYSLLQLETNDKTLQRTRLTRQMSRQTSVDEQTDTDTDTVRFSETNTGNFKHVQVARTLSENESLTYEQTMRRIVQRYIFDFQRQVEVTEDDKAILKKDISTFRYDIDKQPSTSKIQDELQKDLIQIQLHVQKLKEKKRKKGEGRIKETTKKCFT